MAIWIPGAAGFVGRALMARLQADGQSVEPVSRRARTVSGLPARRISALGSHLSAGDVVVYCAGRAHVQEKPGEASRAAFHRANCDEPLAAARLASARCARRFVFVSSIKVNGERTTGIPFSERDTPQPEDDYGRSKWEGEQALWQHARQTGMELVIVRPPLVYGPGVRANFAAMMRALKRGVPLPLASIRNQRSLVYLENLVDFLALCCTDPAAANETFLVSDGRDLPTPELLRLMGEAQGQPARLWPFPVPLLKFGAGVLGRRGMAERLCDSLQVSDDKARNRLVWRPPFSVEEGLRRTASQFGEL
ncbi:NAD-dependent epimerase/dehydratase family protein [Marinimicrobium sp. C2-29]|uniref:NAD-dependent epimerase/dehydratase family protein n=1 Tax=Marinimicrobium sp. C2-29 TaxID=3139825 RepID=UPI003139533C